MSPLCYVMFDESIFGLHQLQAGPIFSVRWGSILVLFLNLALVQRSPSCSHTSKIDTSQFIKICQIYKSKFIIFQ